MDTNQSGNEGGQAGGAPQVPAQTQQAQQPQVVPQQPAPQSFEGSLPQETSQRTTEQFDKLKDHNRRLAEANQLLQQELARKEQIAQQFAPTQQQPQAPTQQPTADQFVEIDPITGEQFVNEPALKRAVEEARQQATQATQVVQSYIQRQNMEEERRQTEEAYKSYPGLNPNRPDTYDAELVKHTRAFLMDSMMTPADYGGRPLSYKEAADLAQGMRGGAPAGTVQEAQQTKENLERRAQASAVPQGVSSSAQYANTQADVELEGLRMQTRKGGVDGTWATAHRLAKVAHTGTPTSSTDS